ncbi:MAG: flagellar biosynthesis regulator FlaF [Henriciella sp.]|uniref:flagellar biosynthesis regulator FlaF n=1 Tax=Henriciella sp. TaxID=1968823 RepID=UPI00260933BE|nr:flagellar biosynthesis regulator FlaF [Henriciella sp.]
MHQLAYKAYGEVTNRTASDKQVEYALFREITQSLQHVSQNEDVPAPEWADAIDRNLQLWTLLSTDLMNEQNQLDANLRRSLIILAESVRRISHRVLGGSEELQDLIDINETIMQGLSGQTGQADAGEAA